MGEDNKKILFIAAGVTVVIIVIIIILVAIFGGKKTTTKKTNPSDSKSQTEASYKYVKSQTEVPTDGTIDVTLPPDVSTESLINQNSESIAQIDRLVSEQVDSGDLTEGFIPTLIQENEPVQPTPTPTPAEPAEPTPAKPTEPTPTEPVKPTDPTPTPTEPKAQDMHVIKYRVATTPPSEKDFKITYQVDDSVQRWTDQEKVILNDYIAKAYEICKNLFGLPPKNDTVKIVKSRNNRGYYEPNSRTIFLPATAMYQLPHEMAHSFRLSHLFSNRGWEEGFAILAELKFNQAHPALKSPTNPYLRENYLENNQAIISTPAFYSDTPASGQQHLEPLREYDRYMMSGYAANQIYSDNSQAIRKFNQAYLTKAINEPRWDLHDEGNLRTLFKVVNPQIQNTDSTTWLNKQYVLKSTINNGKHLAITITTLPNNYSQNLFLWQREQNGNIVQDRYATNTRVTASIKSGPNSSSQTQTYTTDNTGRSVVSNTSSASGCYKFSLSSTGQISATSELFKLLPFSPYPTKYCDGFTLR